MAAPQVVLPSASREEISSALEANQWAWFTLLRNVPDHQYFATAEVVAKKRTKPHFTLSMHK